MTKHTATSSPADAKHPPATTGFRTLRLGRVEYRKALQLQEDLLCRRPTWKHDLLILLEHEPVITAGRSTDRRHLLTSPGELAEAGIDYLEIGRGGDLTYHGPGQLVGYPLLDLNLCNRDLHLYLRRLEAVLLRTLAAFGLEGRTRDGQTGVWLGERKIASIGVGVRRWISWHGFALNIDSDLSGFELIVPCGLPNTRMTSMSHALQREVDRSAVGRCITESFADVFNLPYLGDFHWAAGS